ncbi:MAG: 4Fe-4S dicluster domain-containing protein [Bacteroidales bacterium]|nr:4Fe-4S dicluster domain-containing protein [Bacteroidales bacterium]
MEKEKRAALLFLVAGFVIGGMVFFLGSFLPLVMLYLTAIIVFILSVLFFIPPYIRKDITDPLPSGRIDERNVMFSRRLLEPGTNRFEEYYKRHPEYKAADDLFRKKPGLLNRRAVYYDPLTFPASDAFFQTVEEVSSGITGPVAEAQEKISPARITRFLKDWAEKLGAISSGVAVMKPYHYYHTGGRHYNYGHKIKPAHRFGFVFTVEMDREMINAGPLGPAVMESAHQYLEAGKIAVVIAQYLRFLGYDARAHIDAHYQVVCPLVGRDAGLGEIGRMGLLMTPRLGPRVRIGVVTTNMELIPDERKEDPSVTDFCLRCKKCALNCPVGAIPEGAPEKIDGVKRWQIKQEACYTYWVTVGTDCGRCVAVCPYSHTDNAFHRMVRWGIRRSWLINKLALPMDELFYGKKPARGRVPEWLRQ